LTLLFTCSANGGAHDTFSALLNGASLYPYNVKDKGPAAMADWLIRNQITIYCSVPTVFRYFLETLTGEENFPSLRLIKLIGEPVSKRDVELYQKYFSRQCLLLNRLGSTETGTIRWYFIDKKTQIDGNIVPVGYPADDHEVLLLDGGGREVESEGVGEIAVKSRYLTAGYWRRPDLTDAVFLPAAGDERIYRTGDIGRMLPGGRLLCLGRKDSQVKIRGHRVELTEIEMALMDFPSIKNAVVIAGLDRFKQQCIIAYLVPKRYPRPTVTELRHALGERLPEHMIPSVFMFLSEFPLAPNGKLDRKSLPEPDYSRPELETPYVAPSNPFEIELANIWAAVLGLDRVGMHDNFFNLGGHSLAATRVVSQVIKQFQLELPLQSLFQSPTITEMAAVIEAHQGKKVGEVNLERMVAELELLSDDEARRLIAEESGKLSRGERRD
jgi:acyl-CoA synthetase (AMP-forming)/AMP-acid ligase II/acyl carrier protein